MTILRIDDTNGLYVIAHPPSRADAPTFVFVNAITGTTDHWEAAVAPTLREAGFGTVSYNLRGQAGSDFAPNIELTDTLLVEDLGRIVAEAVVHAVRLVDQREKLSRRHQLHDQVGMTRRLECSPVPGNKRMITILQDAFLLEHMSLEAVLLDGFLADSFPCVGLAA